MNLLETRLGYGLSQKVAAKILDIPVRSLRRYENDENYGNKIKRQALIDGLHSKCEVTETRGVLTIAKIKSELTELFDKEYKDQIEFCVLFGSYAKGCPKEDSDVDLYISCSLVGLRFVGLIEKIRQTLKKKVDLIRSTELNENVELVNEILKDGIRIYRGKTSV